MAAVEGLWSEIAGWNKNANTNGHAFVANANCHSSFRRTCCPPILPLKMCLINSSVLYRIEQCNNKRYQNTLSATNINRQAHHSSNTANSFKCWAIRLFHYVGNHREWFLHNLLLFICDLVYQQYTMGAKCKNVHIPCIGGTLKIPRWSKLIESPPLRRDSSNRGFGT